MLLLVSIWGRLSADSGLLLLSIWGMLRAVTGLFLLLVGCLTSYNVLVYLRDGAATPR